ncbi:MAG: hypothetical protein ACMXYE_02050 [Candidatus Woesearchaeota archaeon]
MVKLSRIALAGIALLSPVYDLSKEKHETNTQTTEVEVLGPGSMDISDEFHDAPNPLTAEEPKQNKTLEDALNENNLSARKSQNDRYSSKNYNNSETSAESRSSQSYEINEITTYIRLLRDFSLFAQRGKDGVTIAFVEEHPDGKRTGEYDLMLKSEECGSTNKIPLQQTPELKQHQENINSLIDTIINREYSIMERVLNEGNPIISVELGEISAICEKEKRHYAVWIDEDYNQKFSIATLGSDLRPNQEIIRIAQTSDKYPQQFLYDVADAKQRNNTPAER